MRDTMTMRVSSIVKKDGKKLAYVIFEDIDRSAEGVIPVCKIMKSEGFTDEEIGLLEQYMKDNLEILKNMAADLNLLDALRK